MALLVGKQKISLCAWQKANAVLHFTKQTDIEIYTESDTLILKKWTNNLFN